MKVLFLISGGDVGGAKTHVYALLDRLKYKCDVELICFIDGDFAEAVRKLGVKARVLFQKSRFDLSVAAQLTEIVKNEKFDLVHCHGARANFIAASVKKKIGVPLVTTMHSDYRLDFDGVYRKITYTTLNILSLSKIDYYIAVSSSFKKMLVNRNFEPNRIFTVYNGMDYSAPFSYESKSNFLKRFSIKENNDELFVGIIGRHDFVKGHDIFMRGCAKVAKKMKNVRFLLAGNGDGEKALKEIAEKEGVADRFVFCGFIKDIYSFINAIDVNCITSRSESFPYMLLEGARLKKATVSSNVGGIPDIITDEETGMLFQSENVNEFAEKLETVLMNPQLRKFLGENLYKRAVTQFSSENLANEHIKIYNTVLKYSSDTKTNDIVLSGYYGFDNIGDDALLRAILFDLKRVMPDVRIEILTNKPAEGRRQSLVNTAYRYNPFSLRRIMKNSKMLISGGGSLIQDATSSKSLHYYLYTLKLAERLGIKTYVYANGIGPLKERHYKIVSSVLKNVDKITLRDLKSADELKKLLPGKEYVLTADPAIGLHGNRACGERLLNKLQIPTDSQLIGISIRKWRKNDKKFEVKMADLINRVYDDFGLVPVFIPMKYPSDIGISERVSRLCKKSFVVNSKLNVDEVIDIISRMDIIIGMRLHSLIFAAGNAVAGIGITYDPKVESFMEYIGQERTVSAEHFDVEKTYAYIKKIVENKEEIKSELIKKSTELYEKAALNALVASKLLERME